MCKPNAGLHVVVFKELMKLCIHSLEMKELILIIFSKENNFTSFVLSLFLLNLSQALSSNCRVNIFPFIFRGKVTSNPGYQNQIFQCCCHSLAPASCFVATILTTQVISDLFYLAAITVAFFNHSVFVEKT